MRRNATPTLLALILLLASCGGSGGGGGAILNPPGPTAVAFRVETFLSSLNFPVTMAFAPDGRLFFNELDAGRVRVVVNGALQPQAFATLQVETSGERGLLGLAFDPQFASNRFVYVLYSDPSGVQRVVRFTDGNGTGINPTVIVDNLPSAIAHNGGNIGFGPDGFLYVTIGDSTDPANSQDPDSLAGKILRYNSRRRWPPIPSGPTTRRSTWACAKCRRGESFDPDGSPRARLQGS